MEDFISLNVYFPKTHIPRLKSLQRGRVTWGSLAGAPGELGISVFAGQVSRCEFVHFPARAASLWIGFVTLWIFLEGLECSFSEWLGSTGPWGEAGRDLASTQHAFSPSSPIQFSLVLSLSVAHRCFDDSLCNVMLPDCVSPRNP